MKNLFDLISSMTNHQYNLFLFYKAKQNMSQFLDIFKFEDVGSLKKIYVAMFRFVASIKIINANSVFFPTVLNKLCLFYFIWFIEFLGLKPIKIFNYLINGRGNDLSKQRLLRSTTLLLRCIMIFLYFVIEFTSLLDPD